MAYSSFPRKRRAVQGKSFDRKSKGTDQVILSWPDLIRGPSAHGLDPWASTPSRARNKDVDTRDKPAQDDSKLFPASRIQVFLAAAFSPDSPARKRAPRASDRRPPPVQAGGSLWTPAFPTGQARGLKAHGARTVA